MSRLLAVQQTKIAAVANGKRLALPARNPFAFTRSVPLGCGISAGIAGNQFNRQVTRADTFRQRIKQPQPLDQTPSF